MQLFLWEVNFARGHMIPSIPILNNLQIDLFDPQIES